MENFLNPLLGGVLIGIAVTLMLAFNGRVTGISGILNGAISFKDSSGQWRWYFLSGLVLGGLTLASLSPGVFLNTSGRGLEFIIPAGFIVGFGTIMGSGCTSGHGVCGISRFSIRSILATITFILMGVASVTLIEFLLGGSL